MPSDIIAVLGPTNTGKTHYAIDRMLGYRSGVIGLPLRLLAREVYDKLVALRGPSVVALVTGEERIVPPRAQYWVCTVEAMPSGIGPEFLAVDEIQLCADPERGHVFTDRLLHARGRVETLFMGSDTMRGRIANLIPEARFVHRERFSALTYTGVKKVSRMPPRAAIVAFSVDEVYGLAELLRRQKGGAAVVMGALSPRTRNAQVELYQNGDVDYLVATDAIGMGLNLDVSHVAFAGTSKFDGRRHRYLRADELAQIAGRAGRFTTPGSFGVTGAANALEPDEVEAIENHQFAPLRKLEWRNSVLDYGSIARLIASLELNPTHQDLVRAREADDLIALKTLAANPHVAGRAQGAPRVKLLWDICQVPDFRKVSAGEHANLLARLYDYLTDTGRIPDDFMARHVAMVDRTEGNIDALSKRLAFIRTWTYVAQRPDWLDDAAHWRDESRAVEDRLSDALHMRLTQQFVDRRTSVLTRRLKLKEALVAELNTKGEVTVEGEFIGRLDGFRFQQDPTASGEAARTLRAAALAALAPAFSLRADTFYNAPDTEIDFTEQGGLMWGEYAVGKLTKGADALSPGIEVFVDEDAGPEIAEKVRRRLGHWLDRRIAALFEPLIGLKNDESLTGLARGVAFRLVESLGVLPRHEVASDVKSLEQDARGALRKHGIRFGQFTLFMPLMLKPAPTRLRLLLWALNNDLADFPPAPPPGLVTVPALAGVDASYYPQSGYRLCGERAIRIDMLERLADMLRSADTRGGFENTADMLSITGLTLEQFAALMQGMGYSAERGERPKVGRVAEGDAVEAPKVEGEAAEAAEGAETAPVPEVEPEAAPAETAEAASDATTEDTAEAAPELEVFYTFRWAPPRRTNPANENRGKPAGEGRKSRADGKAGGKPAGKGPRGKGKQDGKGGKPGDRSASKPAPRPERKVDPDNPFAMALAGFKPKS